MGSTQKHEKTSVERDIMFVTIFHFVEQKNKEQRHKSSQPILISYDVVYII